jgi:NitT/TauT family transport system permease protein
MIRPYKIIPHAAFLFLVILILSPSVAKVENRWAFFAVVILIETTLIFYHKSQTAHDIVSIIFVFFIIWEITSAKIPNRWIMWYPVPEDVFAVFLTDWKRILTGVGSSFGLLFTALALAQSLGLFLGIIVGWFERLRNAILPMAKIISPIPPIIYIPYSIALLPTFRAASIFVIFNGMFWSLFIIMVVTVANIDRRVMESAKILNTKTLPLILQILFPYCLPRVFERMNNVLSSSFMVLTAAEMIGSTSGLGYYVRRSGDFADYKRVVAGIIVIAVAITFLNKLVALLQKLVIRWR